jgi:AraC family transcriptional regulator, regulatory protein of adaptative response / methylated-DNA-[protein]-cysteine methyltransferase
MGMPNPVEQTFWEANYWDAVQSRDSRMDGIFYYAVLSTGVYCRPSCHSRQPLRENVVFFAKREFAERAGFRACLRCRPHLVAGPDPQVEMVQKVCRFIESHLDENVTLTALGKELGLSPFHVQRTFKEVIGITPKAYADSCRLKLLKSGLHDGQPVTRAMYDAGYGSSSRLYERTDSQLGMTPAAYRKGGAGMQIRYSIAESSVGKLLVAATGRGICSVQFGDSGKQLEAGLRAEFGAAEISEELPGEAITALLKHLSGSPLEKKLPLDIRATAFQRRVWEHLQSIPYGRTESYTEVAEAIGHPTATRAVARACAANPVAIAIPCHRVIRGDGSLGGYRWGVGRKKALIEGESSVKG